MAHYLVSAIPRENRLGELENRLVAGEFVPLEPFGEEVDYCLKNARRRPDGAAVWEEEDYCRPPLAQERAAVLDEYFDKIEVESVKQGKAWEQIVDLPKLFPMLAER